MRGLSDCDDKLCGCDERNVAAPRRPLFPVLALPHAVVFLLLLLHVFIMTLEASSMRACA